MTSYHQIVKWQLLFLFYVATTMMVDSWKDCDLEQGGGICPDHATCCPTGNPGTSACIPSRSNKDPDASGECCDYVTGCAYGFQCDLDLQNSPFCKIEEDNPPKGLSHSRPRYELCQITSPNMTTMYGFPIAPFKKRLAYHSNMGLITSESLELRKIEKILIMIHGSSRNADDYFCAALSLIPKGERGKVLILTPKFLAPEDEEDYELYKEDGTEFLIWQDESNDKYPLSHTWRYGADALNAPLSSYETLDRLLEFLVLAAPVRFPSLQQISVAGHSAGGQVIQRWALLSNSFVFYQTRVEIRAIAANPRSYCYLDRRRILPTTSQGGEFSFRIPSNYEFQLCPEYNDWTWGLEPAGSLNCPYKDRALRRTPLEQMAKQFAFKNVFYLTGAYDVLPQEDHCATYYFQGNNRHERALYYFEALMEYYKTQKDATLRHQLYTISESPHDHTLMFQSEAGRNAIFNNMTNTK